MPDPDIPTLIQAAEQRYALPPNALRAVVQVESSGNPRAVSPQGAKGLTQLMPGTAQALGVSNPFDPAQSIDGGARLLRQNLDATGGDIDRAMMMYHGGPDTRQWGPKTQAYPGKILAALTSQGAPSAPQPSAAPAAADPSDPFEQAVSGSAAAPDPNDPFEQAVASGKTAGNAHPGLPPVRPDNSGAQNPRPVGVGSGANVPGSGALPADGQMAPAGGRGLGSSFGDTFHDLNDVTAGVVRGIETVPNTVRSGIEWAERKLGVSQDTIDRARVLTGGAAEPSLSSLITGQHPEANPLGSLDPTGLIHHFANSPYDPNGTAYGAGEFGGEAMATAPLSDLKLLQLAGPTGKLASALARYGDMSLQGAAAGAATSEGNDVGSRAAWGAALAPALGVSIDAVAPSGIKLANGAKGLANALRERTGLAPAPPAGVMPKAVEDGIRSMIDAGSPYEDIAKAYPEWAGPSSVNSGTVKWYTDYRAKGGKAPVNFQPHPEPMAPADVKAASGSAGARSGIESTATLPPQVAQEANVLRGQGVPDAEALNEASLRYVGADPTVASVTRNRAAMEAEKEGAKLTTPEGQALAARQSGNNAALHDTVQNTVQGYGGVPAQGEAAETAAQSLANASDATKAKVDQIYAAARETDGNLLVDPTELRAVLSDPVNRAAVTNEGAAFVSGMSKREGILNPDIQAQPRTGLAGLWDRITGKQPASSPRGMSMSELEQLRQAANDAYDPTGQAGERNRLVGQVKGAIDSAMDRLGQGSKAYGQARAAYKSWAQQYEDPAGLERLIRRDAKGNFINADNWRQAGNGLVGTTSDRQFAQVVRQLQAIGDTRSLGRLKAEVVQRAYEAATKTATTDELHNTNFSAVKWNDALNAIGMKKLTALFSKDEIAHLATVGRAARAINEAVPGTVNTSNTASKSANLAAAMANAKTAGGPSKLKTAVRVVGHPVAAFLHPLAPGLSNVALEGAVRGAEGLSKNAANKALAQAIQQTLDPQLARSAARTAITKETDQIRRAAMARQLSTRLAPAGGDQRGR